MKHLIEIFRSSCKQEMYLYVAKARGLMDVPEPLMKQFGEAQSVMTLVLDPDRKLARANAAEVLQNIEEQGFYLQMPPTAEELLRREGSRE
ncbi:YcgL domain-containing protein [Seongchinamella sediminis]|uniref:YcgL domain-containing protein DWB85_05635 n=1 Tax=Seongchinamella sediminis TaxID=2283635 RepID=A0A3L7E3M2_9GAMM|nr:YcgL domain-containing protein [Seongchinamella sediminis]RLQ22922.1 YcgL domain-containing protein [Seongchinamella sediminis]